MSTKGNRKVSFLPFINRNIFQKPLEIKDVDSTHVCDDFWFDWRFINAGIVLDRILKNAGKVIRFYGKVAIDITF